MQEVGVGGWVGVMSEPRLKGRRERYRGMGGEWVLFTTKGWELKRTVSGGGVEIHGFLEGSRRC